MTDELLKRATEARSITPSCDCSGFKPHSVDLEVGLFLIVAIICYVVWVHW